MSNVKDFGATGDGKTDDTQAIQHALDSGDGVLAFPRGNYRITKTLLVDLAKQSRRGIHGSGGTAKLIMHGPGPAIFLKGTHSETADPNGFRPVEWERERMPTVAGLEIEGKHKDADGIRIVGVMQPTLTGVLIRKVRTAVHVTERARNLLVSHCHFYHNTGVGLHLDRVNLHQAIVTGSHISYCRLGGIRVEKSEVRNLQITGNDIEYNNNRPHKIPDAGEEPTAEIFLDAHEGRVREGTIASNTIQATYSKNGANIRFIGPGTGANHNVGLWTISGNLIGSQEVNVHLTSARGVTVCGNYIYSGHRRNLLVEGSRNIVVGSNCFGHNPDYRQNELFTGLRFVDSVDCVINGVLVQDHQTGRHTVPDVVELQRTGLVEFVRCQRTNISGSQVIDSAPYGLYLEDCSDTLITGTTVLDSREKKLMQAAIRWKGEGTGNLIANCRLGAGTKGTVIADGGVKQQGNLDDG